MAWKHGFALPESRPKRNPQDRDTAEMHFRTYTAIVSAFSRWAKFRFHEISLKDGQALA
jgi:hypothetical protein